MTWKNAPFGSCWTRVNGGEDDSTAAATAKETSMPREKFKNRALGVPI